MSAIASHAMEADLSSSKSQLKESLIEKTNPHMRPRPGRRRTIISGNSISLFTSLVLIIFISIHINPTAAASTQQRYGANLLASSLEIRHDLGTVSKDILYDRRWAPVPQLRRRQDNSSKPSPTLKSGKPASTTSAQTSEESASSSPSSSSANSNSENGIDTAPTGTTSPLPTAFDGGLGTNYTQASCPAFLKSMVNSVNFTSCLPFSVLLQNSVSFFQATRSLETTTQALQFSCAVDFNACSATMSSFAQTLRSPTGCSDDFTRQQPLVRQAYNALLSYAPLYHASCLHATPTAYNNKSSNYCFADAITNTSSPSNNYIYYLALGIPLPAGSMPTCDQCLIDTMNVFDQAAGNKSQPISLTYVDGAQLVDITCGPGFVNASAPATMAGTGDGSGGKNAGNTLKSSVPSLWALTLFIATVIGGMQILPL